MSNEQVTIDITGAYALEVRCGYEEAEPVKSGISSTGREWESQTIYAKKGNRTWAFDFFGSDIPRELPYKRGDEVIIEFFINVREGKNGGVFTKLSGKSIRYADGRETEAQADEADADADLAAGMPF